MDCQRPSTPLSIRTKQHLPSSPSDVSPIAPYSSSSRDSGYGSESTTPEKNTTPLMATFNLGPCAFNGNGPEPELPAATDMDDKAGFEQQEEQQEQQEQQDPSKKHADQDDAEENGGFRTPKKLKLTSVLTPPKTPRKRHLPRTPPFRSTRTALPAAYFRTPPSPTKVHRGSASGSFLASLSKANGTPVPSLRTADRFVHPRKSTDKTFPLFEMLHLTKHPEELSLVEKVLRHSGANSDVFSMPPPRFNPMPTGGNQRRAALQESGFPALTRAGSTLGLGIDNGGQILANDNIPPTLTAHGSVWSSAPLPPMVGAVDDGRGNLFQTGTNAPYYLSDFVLGPRERIDDKNQHSGRLAAAMDFDQASRILQCSIDDDVFAPRSDNLKPFWKKRTLWDGTTWVTEGAKKEFTHDSNKKEEPQQRPLRILSAPNLRDDFYCSLLAYSPTCDTVAIGLGDLLYRWSEAEGAKLLNGNNTRETWLTALAFSSAEGGKNILAFGRSNGTFGLSSMQEPMVTRMLVQERAPISCISWRPTVTMRPSKDPTNPGILVATEDLIVGDDSGAVLYYVVEWPEDRRHWQGNITVVSRIAVHSQQICGLAWSTDGSQLATGANDNMCYVFRADDVLPIWHRPGGSGEPSLGQPRGPLRAGSKRTTLQTPLPGGGRMAPLCSDETHVRQIYPGMESGRFEHGAAVKAIAFCPWQKGLVATGGGSNDKCIHFFHTTSGSMLGTIFVSAQVTSLIWSTTRHEIAVTFGFTHPFHPIRVAVYAWPSCKQEGKHRALFGISCARGLSSPGRPPLEAKDKPAEGTDRPSRTLKEGCIAIASSDESIKFYELWPSDGKIVVGGVGMLGGSDILEDLEGIMKEGDVIR